MLKKLSAEGTVGLPINEQDALELAYAPRHGISWYINMDLKI
ncbi:hypothetical protein [Desulfoscipio gibsoniae]|nr:hypothetical protein [Desulfoscipio gibsoniae]